MSTVVSIAGVGVEIRATGALRPALERLFAGCPSGATGGSRIVVDQLTGPLDLPDREPSVVTEDAAYWFLDTGVVVSHESGLSGRRIDARVVVGGSPCDVPDRAVRLAVQMPLADALARFEREVVHAAAIERDGAAVLVTGVAGAGKSTFAYGAQRAGWSILSDDLTIVAGTTPPVVWGFPKPLHIPDDVLAAPPPDAVAIADDARGRWVVAPPRSDRVDGAPVVAVVALERSDGSASHGPGATGPELVKQILLSFPLAQIPERLRRLLPVAAGLARLPSYVFRHAADPGDRVAAVGEFVDGLVSGRTAQ